MNGCAYGGTHGVKDREQKCEDCQITATPGELLGLPSQRSVLLSQIASSKAFWRKSILFTIPCSPVPYPICCLILMF